MRWLRAPVWWPAIAAALVVVAGLIALIAQPGVAAPSLRIERADERSAPLELQDIPPALVDLNRASRAELLALPGIGDDRADAIIAARAVAAFDSLADVASRGVLPAAALEALKGWAGVSR